MSVPEVLDEALQEVLVHKLILLQHIADELHLGYLSPFLRTSRPRFRSSNGKAALQPEGTVKYRRSETHHLINFCSYTQGSGATVAKSSRLVSLPFKIVLLENEPTSLRNK